ECRGPYCIKQWNNPENVFALIKPLSGGDYAIGMFNFGDKTNEMSLQFFDIGLPYTSGRGLEIYDCYKHETIGTFTERLCVQIPSHDCMMYHTKVVKA
ncbi:MAG: glycoside hydrolase family 27 protein, partial [Oscillospiraceae bacterium]|nr:glycoside hydrolase family 27 protein [Oscillospiraceae bacterium]